MVSTSTIRSSCPTLTLHSRHCWKVRNAHVGYLCSACHEPQVSNRESLTPGGYGSYVCSLDKTGFMANWTTGLIWAFAKTSFFLMYLQLFKPLEWIPWTCHIGLFLNWGFYSGVIAATLYFSAPHVGETWLEASMTPRAKKALDMTIPIASGSLFLDIYILIIPIIAIWGLQLETMKKLRVCVVFGTGIMSVTPPKLQKKLKSHANYWDRACVASTLAIVYKTHLNNHTDDWTYWVYPTMLISLVEMCVGITCSCMPSTAGFLKRLKGGDKFSMWSMRLFSLRRIRTGSKKSDPSSSSSNTTKSSKFQNSKYPTSITAKTYINIENETSSTHELTTIGSAGEGGQNWV
jgi:hypothetical protein